MTDTTPEEKPVTEAPKPRRNTRKPAEKPAEAKVEEAKVEAGDALEKLVDQTSVPAADLEMRVPELESDDSPARVIALGSIVQYVTRAGVVRPAIVVTPPVDEGDPLDLVVFNQQNGAIFVGGVEPGDGETKNTYTA